MMTDPTPEHTWLQQLVGTWTCESECAMGPDGETAKSSGREVVRALGDLWIIGEMTGTMPGGASMTAITTLGFDPATGRFIGNWVGSPMASMFIYDGERDAGGTILTLDCTGPGLEDPSVMAEYQDIVELVGTDERRFSSQVKMPDGTWHRFMQGVFRREG